jgi:hypothetical protein
LDCKKTVGEVKAAIVRGREVYSLWFGSEAEGAVLEAKVLDGESA